MTQKGTQSILKHGVIVVPALGALIVLLIIAIRTLQGQPFIGIPRLLIVMIEVAASLALLVGTRNKPAHAPNQSRVKRALSCACWGALRGVIIGFNLGTLMTLKPIYPNRIYLATQQDQVLFLFMVITAGLVTGFVIGLYFGAKSN